MSRRRTSKTEETSSLKKIQDDIARKKRVKRRYRRRVFFRRVLVFSVLIGIIALFVTIDQSSVSRVRDIQVNGNHYLTQEEIIETSGVEVGRRLLFTTSGSIRKKVQNMPGIANAEVKVYYTKGLVSLTVEEYSVVGYQKIDDQYNLLFADNYRKQMATLESLNVPILVGFTDALFQDNPKFAARLAKIDRTAFNSISEIHVETNELETLYLRLVMNNGFFVYTSVDNLMLMDNYAEIITGIKNGENPDNRCIQFLDYGNTPDTQIAVSKPCS